MFAEDSNSLKIMLEMMEKYIVRQKLCVNTRKTKIVVLRNEGRGKKEEWEFKGEELQEVKEFTYLEFWFEASNNYKRHMQEMAQKAANATWGVGERNQKKKIVSNGIASKRGYDVWGGSVGVRRNECRKDTVDTH